jgi:hypothetical protein
MMLFILYLACHSSLKDSSNIVDVVDDTKIVFQLHVFVHYNEIPIVGAIVQQPGREQKWTTGDDGKVQILIDTKVDGVSAVSAWSDGYHIRGEELEFDVDDDLDTVQAFEIELEPLPAEDNVEYKFQHPGTPEINNNTKYCSHCHVTINEGWYGSVHQTSASNQKLWNLYEGTTQHDENNCNGNFVEGKCYITEGVLPTLNNCSNGDCESDNIENTGQCSNCHAPGINGPQVDKDLRMATDIAYDYGVHCDVCHKISEVDIDHETPGVGGKLQLLRPEYTGMLFDGSRDLHFGPYSDVLNSRMNSSYRAFYRKPTICSGCHEYQQKIPTENYDPEKWPEKHMPAHSTYSELTSSDFGDGMTCQSCHMPPAAHVGNSVDLGNILDLVPDAVSGWYRPAGQVRQHTFIGPRTENTPLLKLAASLEHQVVREEDEIHIDVTVTNIGAGHAIPTGVPLRSMILHVEMHCGDEKIQPKSGDIIDEIGGFLEKKTITSSLESLDFENPRVGLDVLIVKKTENPYDYEGFEPFNSQFLEVEKRGWFSIDVVGRHKITDVVDGKVTLDPPLPSDISGNIYVIDRQNSSFLGEAGVAFARVFVDQQNRPQVPGFLAVDIQRDNRILPKKSWTSNHHFITDCEDPVLTLTLWHRNVPQWLAMQRGWTIEDQIMVQQQVSLGSEP